MNREELFEHLRDNTKVLVNEQLEQAFLTVDRGDFVDPDYQHEAYEDYALPLGNGQFLTQPSTTAFMLELLGINEADSVLIIGSGSGYTTALASTLAGPEGNVLGLDIVPEFIEKSQINLEKNDVQNARILLSDPRWSLLEDAMFDKILVTATAQELPPHLLARLNNGGTLVIPLQDSLFKIEKVTEEEILDDEYPGFTFAPLV